MTGLGAGVLSVAAILLGWPVRTDRARLRSLGLTGGPGWRVQPAEILGALGDRRTVACAAGVAAVVVGVVAGPVAGLIAGGYTALGVHTVLRRGHHRAEATARTRALDELAETAADLRAGLPLPTRLTESTVDGVRAVWRRAGSAIRLAERTGAPLADLLDRVEADGRAVDRVADRIRAESAGARMSAWLLGALPVFGVGLGTTMGVDTLRILLHTPLGALCAVTAFGLQVAGIRWVDRLARGGS